MHRLRGLLLEERDRRGGGRDLRGSALDVQLRRKSCVQESSGQVERSLLRGEVLVRERDPLLEAPVGDVLEADLGHERDEDCVPVVLRRLDARVSRFHGPAVASEDIHLPVGVEACLEEIEHPSRPSRAQPVLARSYAGVRARRADLRPEIGRRDTA